MPSLASTHAHNIVGSAGGLIFASGTVLGLYFFSTPSALPIIAGALFAVAVSIVGFSIRHAVNELRRGEVVLSQARKHREKVVSVRFLALNKNFGACEMTIEDAAPVVVAYGEKAELIVKEFQNAI